VCSSILLLTPETRVRLQEFLKRLTGRHLSGNRVNQGLGFLLDLSRRPTTPHQASLNKFATRG